ACVDCVVTVGTPVTVDGISTVNGIDIALTVGAQVAGRVTDAATGAGLANVSVEIWRAEGDFVTSTPTDASGAYLEREALMPGTYYARTFNAGNYLNGVYAGLRGLETALTARAPIVVGSGRIRRAVA